MLRPFTKLIVCASLKKIESSIEKVKIIVRYFKQSTTAADKLTKYLVDHGLPPKRLKQECPTRWNSTYYMLERLVELEEPIRATMAVVNKDLPIISLEEWRAFKELCQVLRPFEEITRSVSGENYITAGSVVVYTRCLAESLNLLMRDSFLCDVINTVAMDLKRGLEERFKNIEKSGTFFLCLLIDPRFKMKAFEDQATGVLTKNKLIDMVQCHISKNTPSVIGYSQTAQEHATVEPIRVKDKYSPFNILDSIIESNYSIGTPMSKAIKEVDMYLSDDALPLKTETGDWNDPLKWWKTHRQIYPNISSIVRNNCNNLKVKVP